MKGLVTVAAILLLWAVTLAAGPLEFYLSGGPSVASLDEINEIILLFNTLIEFMNDEVSILPNITGEVEQLQSMENGISFQAGERFWLSDRLALGGRLEYFRTATSTAGSYASSAGSYASSVTSEIKIALDCYAVGLMLTGRYNFLNAGLVLSADLGIGYYYSGFNQAITFQVPPEYPDVVAGLPPEGEAHYSGSTIGFEGGLTLSFPITDWLNVGSSLSYRFLNIGGMTDGAKNSLDLNGDGTAEGVDLGGVTVQFTISLDIDFSP